MDLQGTLLYKIWNYRIPDSEGKTEAAGIWNLYQFIRIPFLTVVPATVLGSQTQIHGEFLLTKGNASLN